MHIDIYYDKIKNKKIKKNILTSQHYNDTARKGGTRHVSHRKRQTVC